MKFSIIVPAYNIERYLEQSVLSVLEQEVSSEIEYEVIIVNDGSIDRTLEISNRLKKQSPHVKVIHKDNGGLSSARNAGIAVAQGDYILFLDGDDFWADKLFLEKLDSLASDLPDVILFSYSLYYEREVVPVYLSKTKSKKSLSLDRVELIGQRVYSPAAWLKCVKRELFSSGRLRFPVGVLSEDCLWSGELLKVINTYAFLESSQYMYRQNRVGSITNIVKEKNILDILQSIEIGLDDMKQLPRNLQDSLNIYYLLAYVSIFPNALFYLKNREINRLIRKFKILLKYGKMISDKNYKFRINLARTIGVYPTIFVLSLLKKYLSINWTKVIVNKSEKK